jgi:hypothetical protein
MSKQADSKIANFTVPGMQKGAGEGDDRDCSRSVLSRSSICS